MSRENDAGTTVLTHRRRPPLNMLHPRTLQLIMDSLRYRVTEMHVDGFRFDLAVAPARELYDVNRLGTFFDIIQQDPVLSKVKLIAEPWDVGPGGYQVGNFPVRWAEWNGKYRDTVRHFRRGDRGYVGELASRLAGLADIYKWTQRGASAGTVIALGVGDTEATLPAGARMNVRTTQSVALR